MAARQKKGILLLGNKESPSPQRVEEKREDGAADSKGFATTWTRQAKLVTPTTKLGGTASRRETRHAWLIGADAGEQWQKTRIWG